MKKMITSLILAASMGLNAVPMASTAEENIKKSYTYNELLEMSDEEVAELLTGHDNCLECGFGDITRSDDEKFKSLLDKPLYGSPATWYENFMAILDGKEQLTFAIRIKDDVELDNNITSEYFGYPSEWKIIPQEVSDYGSAGYFPVHLYNVYPIADEIADFEKYVRLELSYRSLYEYDEVEAVEDIFWIFKSFGACPYSHGDVNLDYTVNMADAVTIMQHISNPDKYPLSGAAKVIGDVDGNDGLTANDALRIQKYLLKQVDNLYEPVEG